MEEPFKSSTGESVVNSTVTDRERPEYIMNPNCEIHSNELQQTSHEWRDRHQWEGKGNASHKAAAFFGLAKTTWDQQNQSGNS